VNGNKKNFSPKNLGVTTRAGLFVTIFFKAEKALKKDFHCKRSSLNSYENSMSEVIPNAKKSQQKTLAYKNLKAVTNVTAFFDIKYSFQRLIFYKATIFVFLNSYPI
jgi:hypothetical protein